MVVCWKHDSTLRTRPVPVGVLTTSWSTSVNAPPDGEWSTQWTTSREKLTAAMATRQLGVRALARRVHCDPALISRLAAGKQNPSPKIAALLDEELVRQAGRSPEAHARRPGPRPGPSRVSTTSSPRSRSATASSTSVARLGEPPGASGQRLAGVLLPPDPRGPTPASPGTSITRPGLLTGR